MTIVRIILAIAVVLASGCSRTRNSVAVDAALLTQVPQESVAIGAIRIKAMRNTPAWKRLLEQKAVNDRLDEIAKETTFDARKDLWELLWSSDGKEPLVYARGEFAPMGLEPKADQKGVTRMNYKGQMMIGDEKGAVWFINSSTAVFGRTEKIRALIDARDTRKAGPSATLRAKIESIPPTAHMWMAAEAAFLPKPTGEGKADGPFANIAQNLPMLLRAVTGLTGHVNLADGVNVEFAAACNDEKGAKLVHDSLRGVLGIARIALPSKERQTLLPVLDAFQVEQRQTSTLLRANLTVGQLEQLQSAMGR